MSASQKKRAWDSKGWTSQRTCHWQRAQLFHKDVRDRFFFLPQWCTRNVYRVHEVFKNKQTNTQFTFLLKGMHSCFLRGLMLHSSVLQMDDSLSVTVFIHRRSNWAACKQQIIRTEKLQSDDKLLTGVMTLPKHKALKSPSPGKFTFSHYLCCCRFSGFFECLQSRFAHNECKHQSHPSLLLSFRFTLTQSTLHHPTSW